MMRQRRDSNEKITYNQQGGRERKQQMEVQYRFVCKDLVQISSLS